MLHARDDYSRELAFLFEDSALARNVRVAHRASFLPTDEDYRSLVAQLRAKSFDAVFLSAAGIPGARMVRQLRELGVQVPVIGTDALNSREFREAVGAAGNHTITPVLYRSNQAGWRNAAFAERFRAAHGREPDHNAAQGYDSAWLLARAIELAKTTRTSAVASALHFMPYWVGVTGLHAFDARGELRAKRYEFQQLLGSEWQPLPGLHLRYQLERAEAEERLAGTPLPAGFSQAFRAEASLEETAALQFEMARRILPVAAPGGDHRLARPRHAGGDHRAGASAGHGHGGGDRALRGARRSPGRRSGAVSADLDGALTVAAPGADAGALR